MLCRMGVSSGCLLKSASENYAVRMRSSETLKSGGSMTGVKAYRASNPVYIEKGRGQCMQASFTAHDTTSCYSLSRKLAVSVLYVAQRSDTPLAHASDDTVLAYARFCQQLTKLSDPNKLTK